VISVRWVRETVRVKQGVLSIMVGRPRKMGRRQPNGQLARGYINPKAQVAAQPHRASVLKQYREHPEAESAFGRLMLNGAITPAQHAAGRRFAELVARFRAVKGYPPINPVAMDLLRSSGGVGTDAPPHVIRAAYEAYDKAYCALETHKIQRAVTHHAVYEHKVEGEEAGRLLRLGLDKLIVHFHINPGQALDRESRSSDSRI
jgi:hypothetical protein